MPRDVRTRGGIGTSRQRDHKTNKKFFGEEWVNYQQSNSKQKIRASILNTVFLLALDWSKTVNDVESNDLLQFLGEADYHIDYDNDMVE
jgi:predicted phosphohydrolase